MSIILEQLEMNPARPEPDDAAPPAEPSSDEELVVGDLLVEDVSIDGMCGVY